MASTPVRSTWTTGQIGGGVPVGVDRITVSGGGVDVWGSADECSFSYQPLIGDGTIIAHIREVEPVNAWTKAGVMMRESMDPNAKHVFMLVSPGKGLAFQRRAVTGGTSVSTAGGAGQAPYWVRLERRGNLFTASKSVDGVAWVLVGTHLLPMTDAVLFGVAVGSHVAGRLATGTFDVIATCGVPEPIPVPIPEPTPPQELPPQQLPNIVRLLHWNLHHGNDPNNKWALPRQMDIIAATHADIVSLNEVEKFNSSYGNIDQAAKICALLTQRTGSPWQQYMVPGVGSIKGIGNAILSRFPMSDFKLCQLSPSRNAVHAAVVIAGHTVDIWSTHLDSELASARVGEVAALRKCVSGIVAGDFNAGNSTTEIKAMLVDYLDAWPTAKGLNATVNFAGNCDGCTKNSRIDYVFTKSTVLTVRSAEVLDTRDTVTGVMASDHKPLLVTYDIAAVPAEVM